MSYLVLVPAQSAEVVQRTKHCCGQYTASAQSATSRYCAEQCYLDTRAECLQLVHQHTIAKACQHKCSLRYREWRTYVHKVLQLFAGFNHLHRSQVDAAQHYSWLTRWTYICLQWWLTVQFDSQIDHVSALHQAVWWCISPSACDVDTHRRTSPDYLVLSH